MTRKIKDNKLNVTMSLSMQEYKKKVRNGTCRAETLEQSRARAEQRRAERL